MQKKIENKLEQFVRGEIAGIHRIQMTHGTMYLVLDKPGDCDFVHNELRTFYKENINPAGGVNMFLVGDEFAFDFVPIEDELPQEGQGKINMENLTDDITEGAMKEESDIDVALNLEIDSKEGK
jgi:hypothetical protein